MALCVNTLPILEEIKTRSTNDAISETDLGKCQDIYQVSAFLKGQPCDLSSAEKGLDIALNSARSRSQQTREQPTDATAGQIDHRILEQVAADIKSAKTPEGQKVRLDAIMSEIFRDYKIAQEKKNQQTPDPIMPVTSS